jgi:hypothetical protein
MDQQHSHAPGSTDVERQDLEGGTDQVVTGTSEVDAVLASLDGLDGRPVAEHVEVFEKAHERLRRALDAPAD